MKPGPALLALALAALPVAAHAGRSGQEGDETPNWPRFRGPLSNPVGTHPDLPTRWSTTENVEWVAEVPGVGWSSPIVWGDRVFLTTATSA